MRSTNGALIATVAAVSVAAVVAGGAIAAWHGPPLTYNGPAIPLVASEPASAQAPSAPVDTPTPSTYGTSASAIDLAKLPQGRAPQMTYLRGRALIGGAGTEITFPGRQNILAAVRFGGTALALLEVGLGGSELARLDVNGTRFESNRLPDVQSIKTTPDNTIVAFGTAPKNADHTAARGSAVYWQRSDEPDNLRRLDRPSDWGSTVLAVTGNTVYFRSEAGPGRDRATFSRWDSHTGKVEQLEGVVLPQVMNHAATAVADSVRGGSQTFCTALVAIKSRSIRWQTCELAIKGFTPNDQFAMAGPGFRNGGADPSLTVVNADSGAVVRKWTGVGFVQVVAEDDEHLLITADSGEGTAGAIIRCAISTGGCERATELSKKNPVRSLDLRLIDAV
ncbi:hypothetical protein [Kribbella deserti]|uniref:WD40 repeat domain-containing protein n=1 Tax=Kribbella deserti TaxID=1926257 RepID=A0ABV6QSH5_9ACTN